ncbi:MAG: DUF3786 domain-containing protein [Deltaproteobacteria bacterium]|nr:DUF3786 domain-containing protein [Deltaproteobacteria bacterium]
MARIDDYINAVELGKKGLLGRDLNRVADESGSILKKDSDGRPVLTLDFLNRRVAITWPELAFSLEGLDAEVPIQQQVLLLHYLNGAGGSVLTGEWISYQEVPDGKFYMDAFLRRAKNPMVQGFGGRPELLVKLAKEVYGAMPSDHGDASVVIRALPLVPVALILWKGDEEFPAEGTILFDKSVPQILSAEDIAWLSGMIIYPLMGMAGSA